MKTILHYICMLYALHEGAVINGKSRNLKEITKYVSCDFFYTCIACSMNFRLIGINFLFGENFTINFPISVTR